MESPAAPPGASPPPPQPVSNQQPAGAPASGAVGEYAPVLCSGINPANITNLDLIQQADYEFIYQLWYASCTLWYCCIYGRENGRVHKGSWYTSII